jgi:hypothetical protein
VADFRGVAQTDALARIASLLVFAAVLATLPAVLASCGAGASEEPSTPPASSMPGGAPAGGAKIAPGLYDRGHGIVEAIGVLEYRDLEGGFWAVIGGTKAEGQVGRIVAVVANGSDYARRFKKLKGLSVIVTGTRLEGPSTRMAGPEIQASSVVAARDAPTTSAE